MSWNHCSNGLLEQLFPLSYSPQSCPSCDLLLGLDHLFFWQLQYFKKYPNCCFDLYDLNLSHRSITMMFKTLINSTCFKYSLGSLLFLSSMISKDDIISRSKNVSTFPFQFNNEWLQTTVFLYVAKFGIIHLYQESNNSKYYNKIIVTRNVTLGAEHMHRK